MNRYSTSQIRRDAVAAALDVVVLIVFAAAGLRNHDQAVNLLNILGTAAPFLAGLVVGWLISGAANKPTALSTGLKIWPVVVIVGMLLRHFVFDDGTAPSFVIVTALFTGATLIGWRAVATISSSR